MKLHKNTNVSYFCDGAVKIFTEQVQLRTTGQPGPGFRILEVMKLDCGLL